MDGNAVDATVRQEATVGDTAMRRRIRWIGGAVFLVAATCRTNALMVFPNGMAWSGDFAASKPGILLSGICDLTDILMGLGGLSFLLSFSSLFPDVPREK